MPRPREDVRELKGMDREQLLAEVARLQAQVDAAPAAREVEAPTPPAVPLGPKDIAPAWQVPRELMGVDLRKEAISAYVSDGRKQREFIPGQTVTGVTVAVKRHVLSVMSQAASSHRLNMVNRGKTVQNAPMEFDA